MVKFLIVTEFFPCCLKIMESAAPNSLENLRAKFYIAFIIQRILAEEQGLSYICASTERVQAINIAFGNVIAKLVEDPSMAIDNDLKILTPILRCYIRLYDNRG